LKRKGGDALYFMKSCIFVKKEIALTQVLLLASILDRVLPLPNLEGVSEVKLHKRLTDNEFFELCSYLPDYQIEQTKNGKLIIMPPVGLDGGIFEGEAYGALSNWRAFNRKGKSPSPSTGFRLPDGSTHAADGSWISDEKIAKLTPEERKGFAHIVPDFVIEVRSNSDRIARLKKKMKDVWIKNGVRLAWLIDPIDKKAYIYRQNGTSETIPSFDHVLSGEDVCVGFKLDLGKINL
jgi:Uma2 family endonuclease